MNYILMKNERVVKVAESAISILHDKAWRHAYESRLNLRDAKSTRNKELAGVCIYLARRERHHAHEARIAARNLLGGDPWLAPTISRTVTTATKDRARQFLR